MQKPHTVALFTEVHIRVLQSIRILLGSSAPKLHFILPIKFYITHKLLSLAERASELMQAPEDENFTLFCEHSTCEQQF